MPNVYYFKDLKFGISCDVYEPAEDSLLLAENLIISPGDAVLDIGTGSGIQAIIAAKKAEWVLAVDINPGAIETAVRNAELNKIKNIEFRISNLFDNIKNHDGFDLIIFNPPYLPLDNKNSQGENDMLDASWAGGKNGTDVINGFLESVGDYLKSDGRFEILISSLNNLDRVKKRFAENNLGFEIIARKRLWFEEIYVILGRNIRLTH